MPQNQHNAGVPDVAFGLKAFNFGEYIYFKTDSTTAGKSLVVHIRTHWFKRLKHLCQEWDNMVVGL